MATNLDALRARLNKLQSTQKTSDSLWKPKVGKHQIRLVPYKFNSENPFIELYFHYNIGNRSYLSPSSFGRPDPILEFADRLKNLGTREDFLESKKLQPKLRTYVPVIVRGSEHEGIKFWGFGKTVYQELLGYFSDPDYGDLSHPSHGRDIIVEYAAPEGAATYPTTSIRVKPNSTKLLDDVNKAKELIELQKEITEIYTELSYDDLKVALEKWLSGTTEETDKSATPKDESTTQKTIVTKSKSSIDESLDLDSELPQASSSDEDDSLPWEKEDAAAAKTPTAKVSPSKQKDIESAFDELFK